MTVEKSQSSETYAEITTGIKVDRGYTSPLFITDHRKDECIMEDVKILVCDAEIFTSSIIHSSPIHTKK